MAIIEAILAGERDANKLLSLCHSSIRAKKASQIIKALSGYYTEPGLFSLGQAYSGYSFYKQQILACDQKLEEVMIRANNYDGDEQNRKEIESVKDRKPVRHNKPDIDHLGGHLLKIFSGKDATCLPGITDYSWLQLYSEIGGELSEWPSEKHFTSWLGLSPGQHQSGKKNKTRN
ncbi:transposase, partial [Marinobacterium lacunae]|uniref:transposase n=1 Tax=Marinobacterium lacunae TaxID=1232683 RepID=UPI0012DCAD95